MSSFFRTVKWFQVLLYNSHHLTSVICLHTVCSIWPIDRTLSGTTTPGQGEPGGQWQCRSTPHFPNLQGLSNDIRWFTVISRTLVGAWVGVILLCRNRVGIVNSLSWLGSENFDRNKLIFNSIKRKLRHKFCNILVTWGSFWQLWVFFFNQGCEGQEPYWSVRYQARLILSKCYSLGLPW